MVEQIYVAQARVRWRDTVQSWNQHAKAQASDAAAVADLGLERRRVAEWRRSRMADEIDAEQAIR